MKKSIMLGVCAGACISSVAFGQVIINEVLENPPGSGSTDDVWEYIELYGKPGMDLTGYAIGLAKGGRDEDGDGIPDVASERFAEIDEAFTLDGLTLGANGLLVLYGTNTFGVSSIPALLDPDTNSAPFSAVHIPTTDTQGKLANDNSSTYLLVRKRPNHEIDEKTGDSVYLPGYSFRKDINPDVDFDSNLDCGVESPVGGAPGAQVIESVQIVDSVAWSHQGGKEYTRSSEQEISDTQGFNPDGVSRIAFYMTNPELGHRFNSSGKVVSTRMADEEFIYGDLISVAALEYNSGVDVDGFIQSKAPTDPNGPGYDGSCDPSDPMSGCMPNGGMFLFDDMNTAGYTMSPGALNDADLSGMGGPVITQFQFVEGDFDFDGVATTADFALMCAMEGASLDDSFMDVCSDGVTPMLRYVFEDRAFQQAVAMTMMSDGDDANVITAADITAHRVMLGFGVAPDQDGNGVVDGADLANLLAKWNTNDPIADLDCSGVVNGADLAQLLAGWN